MPAVLTTLNNCGSKNDQALLIARAADGDIRREEGTLGPIYFINNRRRGDVLPTIAQIIRDGFIVDPDPDAPTSTLRPTAAGLAKIGRTR